MRSQSVVRCTTTVRISLELQRFFFKCSSRTVKDLFKHATAATATAKTATAATATAATVTAAAAVATTATTTTASNTIWR